MIPEEAEPLFWDLDSWFLTATDFNARRRFVFLSPTGSEHHRDGFGNRRRGSGSGLGISAKNAQETRVVCPQPGEFLLQFCVLLQCHVEANAQLVRVGAVGPVIHTPHDPDRACATQ
ncbi:hypothetical protein [Streptantibioticus ferralitis]|uniref:Uncharacterized protein n=1 Tax=Streptantibioticus ferralitis TaxID=236510 RepID=A0ABT5ZCN1_9ACTN|nr:hypothetical protein [Streptantibioticus ferralitis]MDF2261612.1 hypothetical protein [Streptantibioticus ferralitis]